MSISSITNEMDFQSQTFSLSYFQRYNDRRTSISSVSSSHDSGSVYSKRSSRSSFSSRKKLVSSSAPCRLGKEHPQSNASARSRGLLCSHHHRVSLPIMQSRKTKFSRKNAEWDCSNTMQRRAIFLHDAELKPSLKFTSRSHRSTCLKKSLDSSVSLPSRSCQSKPTSQDLKTVSLVDGALNKKNKVFPHGPQIKSSMTCETRQTYTKRNGHVSFSEISECACHTSPSIAMSSAWYKESDTVQFLNDTTTRARIIGRTMEYTSKFESTYNSSTGLTSPQVLSEYLSSPQEIIGLEHLLSAQRSARESLRSYNAKALLEEQRRQKQKGCYDPYLLAEMLSSRSIISAYLAKERASYIALLD